MKIPFGEWQGRELSDVPHDHLAWLASELEDDIDKKTDLLAAIEEELAT